VPIPDGITPGQLRALSALDEEAVARLAELDDRSATVGKPAEPAGEG
jgi:hypothetical protein